MRTVLFITLVAGAVVLSIEIDRLLRRPLLSAIEPVIVKPATNALPRSSTDAAAPERTLIGPGREMLDRPLFRRDRRPPAPPPPPPKSIARQAPPPVDHTLKLRRYRLIGTLVADGDRIAFLRSPEPNELHTLRLGDQLHGFAVEDIAQTQIRLRLEEAVVEMTLQP